MNIAQKYTKDWLAENDIKAVMLSEGAGKNIRYVSNWFSGCGSEYKPVFALHPIVQFPEEILEWAREGDAAEKVAREMVRTARGAFSAGIATQYDPQPYPITVAKFKANPPPYNWRAVA